MDEHFRVLEAEIALSGPEAVIAPIAAAYSRFRVDAAALTDPVRVDAAAPPLLTDLDPTFQLYQRFLNALADQIDSCAILHGAALVDPRGRGVLLAAPSGHGKSSLSLELLRRGFRFLGDDYAPLELPSGLLHPYPRAVAVVPGGSARLPEAIRQAAETAGSRRLFGKILVDPGEVLGEPVIADCPVPLGQVILLGDQATLGLELGALHDVAPRLEQELQAIDGVKIELRQDMPRFRLWRLSVVSTGGQPNRALADLLRTVPILYCQKRTDARPDFSSSVELTPVPRREAARCLALEQMNRPRSSPTALLFELAGALRDASCWRLRPGPLTQTADAIQALCLRS